MLISLVAAVDQRSGIGRDNRLPWHLSDDLKHFRRLTMGHHVLMGRKTYESSQGKMPGRKLIVLSRSAGLLASDVKIVSSLEAGIQFAQAAGETELFIIGGAQVFAQALPFADHIYYTEVHADAGADTFFPDFDCTQWKEISRQDFPSGPKNDFPFSILHLEKTNL
ncbi:MAG: dihydrofolate reductase [Chloroflexi bacterium]|nr:dihydrofolate reductase [Chloroflexota bacterium]